MLVCFLLSGNIHSGNVQARPVAAIVADSFEEAVKNNNVAEVQEIVGTIPCRHTKEKFVNHSFDQEGRKALHIAACSGHNDMVTMLLQNGASVDAYNNQRQTALMLAAQNLHFSTVQLLLQFHADPNKGNILLAAIESKKRCPQEKDVCPICIGQCVRSLIEGGADVKATDWIHQTALFCAAGHRNLGNVVSQILNARFADENDKRKYINARCGMLGETALHCAASIGACDVVTVLLAGGADMSIRNNRGQTPLECALKNPNAQAAVQLLRTHQKLPGSVVEA